MKSQDFENYKNNRYQKEIAWYNRKSILNKKYYTFFQWGLIILAALTPVLIALDSPFHDYSKWLPVLSSVLVSILASGLKVCKFQEKWINYRSICETLIKEIHFYSANLYEYTNYQDKEAMFVQRVESLISKENNLWINLTMKEKKENGN